MDKLKLALPAFIIAAGLIVPATVSFGKPEYTRATGAKCTVCHSQGKNLNKVGECYKEKKDLKVCQAQ
jgi:hypothetical protein